MRTTNTQTKDCVCCGNTLIDWEGEYLRSHIVYEKYVPNKWVYHAVCMDCDKKEPDSYKNNGFVEYERIELPTEE